MGLVAASVVFHVIAVAAAAPAAAAAASAAAASGVLALVVSSHIFGVLASPSVAPAGVRERERERVRMAMVAGHPFAVHTMPAWSMETHDHQRERIHGLQPARHMLFKTHTRRLQGHAASPFSLCVSFGHARPYKLVAVA